MTDIVSDTATDTTTATRGVTATDSPDAATTTSPTAVVADASARPGASRPTLQVRGVDKTFTMHLQGGQRLAVLRDLTFEVRPGECVVLGGPSGAGKSTILKMVYGNYAVDAGQVLLHTPDGDVDIAVADPRTVLAARRTGMGYVSQFLRAVPRVPTIQVVAEPLLGRGVAAADAVERAAALLSRLAIPEPLWQLPPATFSGGEQQRVNIARGFLPDLPFLLLDEPTASLDARNRDVVVELIAEKRAAGVAMLGIFHDAAVRSAIADRTVDVEAFTPALDGALA